MSKNFVMAENADQSADEEIWKKIQDIWMKIEQEEEEEPVLNYEEVWAFYV